jgi:hypothetical protein
MKTCTKCNIEKPLSEFRKAKNGKYGVRADCKLCVKAYKKTYREANKDKIKAYREANKEKMNTYERAYREANKDKIREKRKEWREANKDKIKAYYEANKDKINENRNASRKERRKNDALYKVTHNTRSLIGRCFKNKGYTKKSKTYQILGCTYEEFKQHLERQFTKGMTWENYGDWHLDHIYPVSLAENEEELIKLNHYTNFQPLWAEENLKKSNKIENGKQIKLL